MEVHLSRRRGQPIINGPLLEFTSQMLKSHIGEGGNAINVLNKLNASRVWFERLIALLPRVRASVCVFACMCVCLCVTHTHTRSVNAFLALLYLCM